jgi:FG-GAP-like repeat
MSKRSGTRPESRGIVTLGLSTETSHAEPGRSVIDNGSELESKGWISYLRTNIWLVALLAFFAIGALGAGLKYLDESAQKQRAENKAHPQNKQEQGILSSLNPFAAPAPPPSATPQLSKENVYAGGRLLSVVDAGAHETGIADLAVWRSGTNSTWYVMNSQQTSMQWGTSGDVPVLGDYDGDGKTDFAVFRPTTGVWYLVNSSDSSTSTVYVGTSGDKPVEADFDGDGKTDVAVYRPSNGTWYIQQSSTNTLQYQQFGLSTDLPLAADFDGDGRADMTVWRDSSTTFYTIRSTDGQLQYSVFGSSGDKPILGDYDGDAKCDIAVWRPSNNTWYIQQSATNSVAYYQWGNQSTDMAVQNDYDGDGKVDIAVFTFTGTNAGDWWIRNSSTGQLRTEHFGTSGDIGVPAFYRR